MMNLIHGECLAEMKNIADASVDLILCDLPYGTTACKWDSVIPFDELWVQYKRVAKDNTAVVLFAQTPFDKALGVSNLPMLRYELIWEKTSATGHLNAKKMPMKSHENILVFYSSLPTYNPQKTTGHVRKTAVKRGDTSPVYGKQCLDGISYDSTERYPRSVLTFSSDKQHKNLHPTQKPEALMEYLVRTFSNQGDIVMDNCMGSGTTGVACVNTGRNFIGIEKDPEYFAIAERRISEARQALALT